MIGSIPQNLIEMFKRRWTNEQALELHLNDAEIAELFQEGRKRKSTKKSLTTLSLVFKDDIRLPEERLVDKILADMQSVRIAKDI